MSLPQIIHGDCVEVMRTLPDASVHSIVTDPPYGLGFMGKAWDDLPPGLEWASECLRVLKPGGHLLAFGGTRTWHRLAVAVEDAGFEVRDSIAWLYGSGFPKSLDVSKAIDKAAGAEREVVGLNQYAARRPSDGASDVWDNQGPGLGGASSAIITAPATPDAERWQGWGTALKPAHEPIVVARKPLAGTVAANVLAHGTGALNVDGCRVGEGDDRVGGGPRPTRVATGGFNMSDAGERPTGGRWPANVVLDESQADALDAQSGVLTSGNLNAGHKQGQGRHTHEGGYVGGGTIRRDYGGDSGGASRFFYVAKAPKRERPTVDGTAHPTVKPLTLMRWLVRLVTPPGGTVLEPFAGSGTTVEAAMLEGFGCIAIEREADYLPLIEARIIRATAHQAEQPDDLLTLLEA